MRILVLELSSTKTATENASLEDTQSPTLYFKSLFKSHHSD